MTRQSPELPRVRDARHNFTMVSVSSLRDLRRLLRLVVLLQVVNMILELRGWWG